jgi:hypothetical protein
MDFRRRVLAIGLEYPATEIIDVQQRLTMCVAKARNWIVEK